MNSTLRVEMVPVDRLFCSPSNPRINDPAVPHVAASIRRFGWRQPIVAKRTGEVIAGNRGSRRPSSWVMPRCRCTGSMARTSMLSPSK